MFKWETQKERTLRLSKISPEKKMKWLREINEFTTTSKKIQNLRKKMKQIRSI